MDETLEGRIETLERAVTDGDHDLSTLAEEAEALDRLATAEDRIDELESQVEELDAATQALRGYVGNIRSVNSEVEQRADAALAKAEAVEDAVTDTAEVTTPERETATDRAGKQREGDTTGGRAVDNHREGSIPGTGQYTVGRDPPAEADTGTRSGQRDAVGASTGQTHDTGTPDGRKTRTAADEKIGTAAGGRAGTDHCHACGRPHGTGGHESDKAPETSGPASASETLVESGEKEPGTLERIREML